MDSGAVIIIFVVVIIIIIVTAVVSLGKVHADFVVVV
jgi:hypothetical protein